MISGILHINGEPVERRRLEDSTYYNKNGRLITSRQYLETLPNGRSYPIFEQFGDQGPADNTDVYVVPDGHYFAMGDNRDRIAGQPFPARRRLYSGRKSDRPGGNPVLFL